MIDQRCVPARDACGPQPMTSHWLAPTELTIMTALVADQSGTRGRGLFIARSFDDASLGDLWCVRTSRCN